MRTIAPSGIVVWTAPFFDGSERKRTPSPSVFAIRAVWPPGKKTAPAGEAKRYEATKLVETIAVRHRKPRRVSRSVTRNPSQTVGTCQCAVLFLLWPSGRSNGYADR